MRMYPRVALPGTLFVRSGFRSYFWRVPVVGSWRCIRFIFARDAFRIQPRSFRLVSHRLRRGCRFFRFPLLRRLDGGFSTHIDRRSSLSLLSFPFFLLWKAPLNHLPSNRSSVTFSPFLT